MKQIEQNVMNSFRLAKRDIIQLQTDFLELSQTQEKIMETLKAINSRESKLNEKIKDIDFKVYKKLNGKPKTVVKTVTKRPKKTFVVSKEGGKFHITKCPFAQNIKPRSKRIFKSKNAALNKGYKACNCIK